MPDQQSPTVFDQKQATSYDQKFAKIGATREALQLLVRVLLSELPNDARILCVGVGTGSELLDLAEYFPNWQFTAVEPAPAMLDICRRRANAAGIAARCTFHEGTLDSLPATEPFDAATCLLVSHFIVQPEEQSDFFREISERLRPGGWLVNAALASDMSSADYKSLLEVWRRMLRYAEIPDDEIEKMLATFGRDVALLPLPQIASLIESSGFGAPVLFLQTLLIHAWYAQTPHAAAG